VAEKAQSAITQASGEQRKMVPHQPPPYDGKSTTTTSIEFKKQATSCRMYNYSPHFLTSQPHERGELASQLLRPAICKFLPPGASPLTRLLLPRVLSLSARWCSSVLSTFARSVRHDLFVQAKT
jgi:hypothetical protein